MVMSTLPHLALEAVIFCNLAYKHMNSNSEHLRTSKQLATPSQMFAFLQHLSFYFKQVLSSLHSLSLFTQPLKHTASLIQLKHGVLTAPNTSMWLKLLLLVSNFAYAVPIILPRRSHTSDQLQVTKTLYSHHTFRFWSVQPSSIRGKSHILACFALHSLR